MSVRSAILLASSALVAISSPAMANDDRYGSIPDEMAETHSADGYESEALGEWDAGDADYYDEEMEEPYDDAAHARPHRTGMTAANGQQLGYTMAERDAWLADCQTLYLGDSGYYDDQYDNGGDRNGGLLGGLLGAVVGGVAGNRIADAGDRLGGTLIGAGVGGIAGLLIGSAIDAASDRDDDDHYDYDEHDYARVADYCEAYLRRYEAGAYSYGMQAQPVMMVQMVPTQRPGRYREVVREEWVDVPMEEAARPARRAIAPRAAPEPTKLTPVK